MAADRDRLLAEVGGVWSDLLGLDQGEIAPTDTFFELGGNSVLGVEMLQRLNARYGVDLPVDALFDDGSLASLLDWVLDDPSGDAAR